MIFHDRFEWKGRIVGHMISDTGHEELHRFAARIGLKRQWFQKKGNPKYSHYDLTTVSAIERANRNGAIEVSCRELLEKMEKLEQNNIAS